MLQTNITSAISANIGPSKIVINSNLSSINVPTASRRAVDQTILDYFDLKMRFCMAFTHECQSNIMAEDSEMPITAYLHVDLSETRKQKVCDRFCCNFSLTVRKPALCQLQRRMHISHLSMHVRLAWTTKFACSCLKAKCICSAQAVLTRRFA